VSSVRKVWKLPAIVLVSTPAAEEPVGDDAAEPGVVAAVTLLDTPGMLLAIISLSLPQHEGEMGLSRIAISL
jgi:hypothetical protein